MTMLELNPQFIKTESGELVVLTRAEYEGLLAQVASEDDEDVALFDARMAELAAGSDAKLPAEVTGFMLGGDSLLKALRKWRDMTQVQLSFKTELAQSYISDIESSRKTGTPESLRRIAQALEVDPQWLG